MTLRTGDRIIDGNGKPWMVAAIDAYVWKGRHYYKGIRLVRLSDQRGFWMTRNALIKMCGGYDARSKA